MTTTERITITAAELLPGDRIVPAPGNPGPGTLIRKAEPTIGVDYEKIGRCYYRPDAKFQVDRAGPTVTVELPSEVVDQFVGIQRPDLLNPRSRALLTALKAALRTSAVSTEQAPAVLAPGARVRGTKYGRGFATVVEIMTAHTVRVRPDVHHHGRNRNGTVAWDVSTFEVIG